MAKNDFLTFLDDPEVHAKIREICAKPADAQPATEHPSLTRSDPNLNAVKKEGLQIEKQRSEIENQSREIKQQQDKLDTEKQTNVNLQDKLNNTEKKLHTYEQQFGAEQHAFEQFQQISEETQAALKGIFKDRSPSGFLACGLQEKNILSFWDYCKTRLIENPDDEAERLAALFAFFFQRYLLAYPNAQTQTVTVGERFDPLRHIRTPSSPVSGTVVRVVLAGWINRKTDKIIKLSLVELSA